jgi:hypothetical protein
MTRYQKVKNEWGETEEFTKAVEGVDDKQGTWKGGTPSPAIDYSKHITPDYKGTNEPTLKGAVALVLILWLIGFASCYGLFWTGWLHV